jgi:hypothetical protein
VNDNFLYRSERLDGKRASAVWRMSEKPVFRPGGLDLQTLAGLVASVNEFNEQMMKSFTLSEAQRWK